MDVPPPPIEGAEEVSQGPLPCLTNVIKLCDARNLYCMAFTDTSAVMATEAEDAVVEVYPSSSVRRYPPQRIPLLASEECHPL